MIKKRDGENKRTQQATSTALPPTTNAVMVGVKPRILCVGVAGVDYVASVEHFPQPDEKMRSDSLVIGGGGNSANTACAISRLDTYAEAAIASATGNDANGETIIEGLRNDSVDVTYVERYEGTSPFTYVITTSDPEHSRTCIHQRGDGFLTVDFVDKIPVKEFTAMHFDTRYASAALHLSKKCREQGIPYSLDVEKSREGLIDLMSNATLVLCNATYCDKILGRSEGEITDAELVNRLRKVVTDQAPRSELAVMTLGCRGSCLIRVAKDVHSEDKSVILQNKDSKTVPIVIKRHGALWCPVWGECNVVDTTGAGDAFQGGFLSAVWAYVASKGGKKAFGDTHLPTDDRVLAHSLRIATRVATKKIEVRGATCGLPHINDDDFLQSEFKTLLEL